ncbi:hydroxymethylbilane synthase [Mariniblastus sp.]|nr:hydroxymethylbilane synthase [Mariniblastus sp.]
MPNSADDPTPMIRLGTRASKLAMWQSNWVKSQLEKMGHAVELIQIKTEGDVTAGPLAQIGGQGLFTKQLQVALLEDQIDLAVHSLKDLPTEDHPDLTVAAVPPREDTADAFVSNRFAALDELPDGAVIGTGSVRRAAQLKHLRPNLEIQDIRGNVDTRLKKLDGGEFDAIILAAAGLKRLGLESRIVHAFEPEQLLPAVGQGALGLETRKFDMATVLIVRRLSDPDSYHRAFAERSMLKALFAGCLAPVGASTTVVSVDGVSRLTLTGVVLSTDGTERLQSTHTMPLEDSIKLGKIVAEQLMYQGAERLLKSVR